MSPTVLPSSPAPPAPTDGSGLGSVLAQLACALDRQGPGSLAELRRMTTKSLPPAFWKIYLGKSIPPDWRGAEGRSDVRRDLAWVRLIRCMAHMTPRAMDFQSGFGEELARKGYSEPRFVRLLRAEGEELERELRVAAQWLAIKDRAVAVNWTPPAELLLGRPQLGLRVNPDAAAHRMARGYFRARMKQS